MITPERPSSEEFRITVVHLLLLHGTVGERVEERVLGPEGLDEEVDGVFGLREIARIGTFHVSSLKASAA